MTEHFARPGGRGCEAMQLLIQADLDGELDVAAAAALGAHLDACPSCLRAQAAMLLLSQELRAAVPRQRAPDGLRRQVEAALAPARGRASPRQLRGRLRKLSLVGGAALAAGVAATLLLPGGRDGVEAELLASHVRALQPGHLMDVASSDQHTVKPWFAGRIDYAPPVRDFAGEGFPLLGGRLDYVAGRAVAVLVYGHGRHFVDVYVWPETTPLPEPPDTRKGFHFAYWSDHGMRCSAVSDAEPAALARLVRLWTDAAG